MSINSLVSNGSYKFHLAPLASELERYGCLAGFVAAGWPIGWQRSIAEAFPENQSCRRFLDRWEPISDLFVHSSPVSELLFKVGDLLRSFSHQGQHLIHSLALEYYANHAISSLRSTRPSIYHYRCAYGGRSLQTAKRMGIPILCDHSIAHPFVAEYLVNHQGTFPPIKISNQISMLSRIMASDISAADYLLVNSDFVKDTCIFSGYPRDRIFVVYLGVDNKYLSTIKNPTVSSDINRGSNILYIGGWQKRKGVDTLVEALSRLPTTVRINVAGGIEPELRLNKKHQIFLNSNNVTYHGIVPRTLLNQLYSKSSIFVFPSYCEGSARVIFEAMAAGCFIITTANSGSIVEHGIHGMLVQPGNAEDLFQAVSKALSNPREVKRIGAENADLVRSCYTQSSYAKNVLSVYSTILSRIG